MSVVIINWAAVGVGRSRPCCGMVDGEYNKGGCWWRHSMGLPMTHTYKISNQTSQMITLVACTFPVSSVDGRLLPAWPEQPQPSPGLCYCCWIHRLHSPYYMYVRYAVCQGATPPSSPMTQGVCIITAVSHVSQPEITVMLHLLTKDMSCVVEVEIP